MRVYGIPTTRLAAGTVLALFCALGNGGRSSSARAAPPASPLAETPSARPSSLTPAQDATYPREWIEFRTVDLDTQSPISRGTYRYSDVIVNGEQRLRQTGEFTYPNGNQAIEISELRPVGQSFLPRRYELSVKTRDGAQIRQESMLFSPDATSVRIRRTYSDPTRQEDYGVTDEVDKVIPLPPQTYPRQMFDALLRGMDFKPGDKRLLHVITRLGDVYGIYLYADHEEQLTLPAGTFQAIRLRLIPDIPILPLLMPSLTIRMWYTKDSPHLPLKFEGYAQPPPPRLQDEVRMELLRLERPGATSSPVDPPG